MLNRLIDLLDRCEAERQWARSEAVRAEKSRIVGRPRRPRADQHVTDALAEAAGRRSAA